MGVAQASHPSPQPEPVRAGGQKVRVEGTGDQDAWSFLREFSFINPCASELDPLPSGVCPPRHLPSQYMPNAMDILDGVADLPSEFLLVKLHLCRRTKDGWSGPVLLPGRSRWGPTPLPELGTRASGGVRKAYMRES